MNITIPKFVHLIQEDYSLDVLYILENLEICPLLNSGKGAALLQRMYRKGLIDGEDGLTEKGKEILRWWAAPEDGGIKKVEKPKASDGIAALHGKLEQKLLELTGKKQVRVEIYGSKYSFLCNAQDLEARVKKVMSKYRISDVQKIEDALIGHIERCHKKNKWFPLIVYYLIKQKEGVEMSQLVTDIKEDKEEQEQTKEFEI